MSAAPKDTMPSPLGRSLIEEVERERAAKQQQQALFERQVKALELIAQWCEHNWEPRR